MTTVLLFHHAQGQTKGFLGFADELRKAGHTVHTPDLYDGQTFEDFDEGVGYAKEVGFGEILRRGVAVADDLSADPERPSADPHDGWRSMGGRGSTRRRASRRGGGRR
jgi:dienelactone hydrolase